MKKWCNSNCKTGLLWLTLLLSDVITTAKKVQYNIFSIVKGRPKTKKLLKELNMDVSHVRCTEEGLKLNLEVIILRATTERYLVEVKDKFIFPNLILKFVAENLKICIVKTHFSLSEFLKNFQGI